MSLNLLTQLLLFYILEDETLMKKLLLLLIVGLFAVLGCNKNKNELIVYNWTEYMPDSVLEKFEKETGIKIKYLTYDSNELLYSKLKLQQGSGYDIIFPSTYYIERLAKDGLLQGLDHSKLSNMKNIAPHLMDQGYDKGNVYSIPYIWGAAILGYNSKYVDGSKVTSWDNLWDREYAGKVLLQNDMREVFQMALMTLGYDGNSMNEKEIEEAYEKLKTLVPSVRVFNSDSPKLPFVNEEVHIGLIWTGELYRARLASGDIKYVYPKEGAIVWTDCVAIPKGAKNVDNAHKFIDFIMRPDIALEIAEDIGYSTPNEAALEMMPEELRNNVLMNPTAKELENSQVQKDIGEAVLVYEKYWERLKTGR